jgi:hypothetical protein
MSYTAARAMICSMEMEVVTTAEAAAAATIR